MSSAHTSTFDQALDAVERLTLDEQAELTEIVRRRIAESRREQILKDVEDSRREFANGGGKAMTAEEIIRELQS